MQKPLICQEVRAGDAKQKGSAPRQGERSLMHPTSYKPRIS